MVNLKNVRKLIKEYKKIRVREEKLIKHNIISRKKSIVNFKIEWKGKKLNFKQLHGKFKSKLKKLRKYKKIDRGERDIRAKILGLEQNIASIIQKKKYIVSSVTKKINKLNEVNKKTKKLNLDKKRKIEILKEQAKIIYS